MYPFLPTEEMKQASYADTLKNGPWNAMRTKTLDNWQEI